MDTPWKPLGSPRGAVTRKLRIRLEGRGKSGGGRVIYIDVLEKRRLYLLFAYPKNVQEDLTAEQRKFLRRMAETIMEEWI